MSNDIYKKELLEHYYHPHNRSDLADADIICSSRNSICGDDIDIGIKFKDNKLHKVEFRGRGCSICIASASLMTQTVQGKTKQEAKKLSNALNLWFSNSTKKIDKNLQILDIVRQYPSRKKCVLLAWQALTSALS